MTKAEFENLKEGQLITIKDQKGQVIDIFHFGKWCELRHHNYDGEDYYYLGIALQPKLERVSITNENDIYSLYAYKKTNFDKQLKKILELKNDL